MLPTTLNRFRRGAHGQRGFTLIELMISLLLMGLIMSVVYNVFSSQDRFFRNQEQIASMQENLRATVEYINQELSWLGYQVPGLAVIKAGQSDIIFKANIPNSGSTIQYVRYQFDPSTNTIRRAAGADESFVENMDLTVMASDIESMAISYYNILNGIVDTPISSPLCADELSTAVCSPGLPENDVSLLMVQRVKARVTARTSNPDWMYTDPNGGPNPNFRKRRAVLDLRARNIEDVTLQGGQIVVGSCGYLINSVNGPYNSYAACPDKNYYAVNFRPDPANNTFDDNPYVTIQAYDKDGNLNTSSNQVTYVYAVADDGTPYNMYDSADPYTVNNTILNGETRYVAANDLSNVSTGTHVKLRFAYSDGLCTQMSYEGEHEIIVAANPASVFSTSATMPGGLSVDYVDNSGSSITLATPGQVAMCSSVGNERVILGARLNDDCGNGIPGETIAWSNGGFGGSFVNEVDNGDGTYSATFIPPDTMGTAAAVYTATLSAQWGSFTPNVDVDLIAAQPHDIVIDSIVDITQANIFQFAATVPDRATQLGGNSGSSFTIERVDGQEVGVTFHVEDECGNRVYKSLSINHSSSKGTLSSLIDNGDGSYSFAWESNIGCGLEQLSETITISTSAIANPSTQSETISFALLTTRSSDPLAGPFVLMDKIPIGKTLQAGNTGDYVTVQSSILQYDPVKQYCTNLIPGSMAPFSMQYTLAGDTNGNDSFSPLAPFNDITKTVTVNVAGIAQVDVYPGTADWDDSVTVTAEADIEGAFYSGSIVLGHLETNHPQSDSGFYQDNLYTTKIGTNPDQAITTFKPGYDLFLRIFDYDENEDPNSRDSFSFPYDVKVTIESQITQDVEVVGLTEYIDENSPYFLKTLETAFYSAVATTVQKDDGILQTRDGDTISMTYVDKDNPGDTDTWTINTPGADVFRIYKVGSPDEEILPPAGPLQVEVAYGDKLRPELSLPFLAGDGSINTDTVQITMDSGADTDMLVLREEGDTGIMVPDDILYGNKHFSVAQSDVADADDILATPTTPRYVTLEYNVVGSYAMTLSFFMKDFDPPQVTITAPADGATVSGAVTVDVNVSDVANPAGGISRVELYINGRFVDSIVGADLTGTNSFIWTTAIGSTPYWLDGSHILTAKAFDTSLNEATSDLVGVTVANNLSPIWFNDPSFNSIWSQDVVVQIEVGSLAAQSGTYELLLNVNSVPAMTWTVSASGGIFNHTVDLTDIVAFPSDGTVDLIAVIRDTGLGYYETTALDFIVDRTPAVISIGSPFDLPWIGAADFPLNIQARITDTNAVADSTVTATFSGACSDGPLNMSEQPAGSDTYTNTLPYGISSCDNVEGILTITIEASDVASPANLASQAFTVRLDTKKPTVDTLDVIPMVNQSFTMGSLTFDGFIRGDVTLQAGVTDGNLGSSIGAFTAWYYNDPYTMAGPPDGTQYLPLESYQSAAAGAFTDLWPTTAYPTGSYVLAAGVMDSAGNTTDSAPFKVLYLDNSTPFINNPIINAQFTTVEPLSGWTVPLLHGLVNVSMAASDQSGFLRTVEHRFVNAGDDPGTADTPSGSVLNTVSYSFPADSMKRIFAKSYSISSCTVTPGVYDVFAYATDWAGNKSSSMGTTRFVVENFTYLVPPSAAYPVVSFEDIPPSNDGIYALLSDGTIRDCNGTVGGHDVTVTFFHRSWDGFAYTLDSTYNTVATTDLMGDLPTLSSDDGAVLYTAKELGSVGFYDASAPVIYALFHPMFLGSPQPYEVDPVGNPGYTVLYAPWYTGFQPLNQERLLTNLTHDLTPNGLPAYALALSGEVIFNSGQPAASETLTIEMSWTDTSSSTMSTIYRVATDSLGKFSFTPPADISNSDPITVQFRRVSKYWGVRNFGSINWKPWYGWMESLE
ncbi:MAG: Ig-like domain-containing protein [bacterium]|nr:Ig-like domain-containing protein [bacterium]